jgi:hypothetical protein
MRFLTLDRFIDDGVTTLGRMSTEDSRGCAGPTLYTVERPWLNNAVGVSCIPVGVYYLSLREYNRGGYDAYQVIDVPDRTYILLHRANWSHNVIGCIGIGMYAGLIGKHLGVGSSRAAYESFMLWMDDDQSAILRVVGTPHRSG